MRWLLALMLVPLAACPTPPPVVVPPATTHIHIHVRDVNHPDTGIVGATVRLNTGPETWVTGITAGTDGYAMLTVPADLTDTQLQITAEGWQPIDRHEVVAPEVTLVVPMQPVFVPLPKLVTRGKFFRRADGTPFTAIQTSDFNLFNRYQRGEDIRPILQERKDLGFNLLRVWTLYDLAPGIGVLLDPDYGKLPAFLDLCATYGFYVELTAYTSTERVEHWGKLVVAVQGKTNVLLELVNELAHSVNALEHFSEYQKPAGILASHGSNGMDIPVVQPIWDYVTLHSNGEYQEQRKIGHNAMELWDGPTLTNETSRFPDVGMWKGQTLARQQELAYDAAAGAALLAAGACFHTVSGKTSSLFTEAERTVAAAWVAGARSVPLSCQAGPYKHRQDLEGSTFLRVYERPVSGYECVVRIR